MCNAKETDLPTTGSRHATTPCIHNNTNRFLIQREV